MEDVVNTNIIKATGLALALALSPAAAQAVEVFKSENSSLDLGARMQLLGTFRNSTSTDFVPNAAGGTNRDHTEIFLFQNQNRLKLSGDLEGVLFKFENAMGSEAYPGSNNLYTLYEMNAEIPLGFLENTSVVAGLLRRPESVRDAYFDEDLLFAGESELSNLFFNAGYDTGVYLKTRQGSVDALLGVVQGVGNLPERYIPEKLNLPVPAIVRVGYGNIEDAPDRMKQVAQAEEAQWRVGAGGFWLADSNAGHGTLFGQMATQAEATKGPFVNGNYMFSKLYNPFLALGTYNEKGGQGPVDAQFWQANVNAMTRVPLGEATLVAGAQWEVAQFVVKGLYNRPQTPANPAGGVQINGQEYTYGQLTVQGGEAYAGYVADKWWAAGRVSVMVPDALMGNYTGTSLTVTGKSTFQDNTLWEITFPALGYKLNSFVTLTAELEHNLNAIETIDTNGEYQLKTVPTTANLATKKYQAYQVNGRLQLQVAF
jgi:hypothetical protein